MTEDTKKDPICQYMDTNPNLSTVWVYVMEAAKSFEEQRGFSRREILEGLIFGTLDLAMRREDEPFFQDVQEAKDFYNWVIKWVNITLRECPSDDDVSKYIETHGELPNDAKQYGWKEPTKNSTH